MLTSLEHDPAPRPNVLGVTETTRLGFGPKSTASFQNSSWPMSEALLGIEPPLRRAHSRPRTSGKERDSESGLDNFGARYMSSQYGRFMTPDPSGVAFSSLSAPQSWNLYSYVQNNPLSFVDPDGRECVWDDGSYDSADDPNTGSYGQCSQAGGTYFEPSTFSANDGQNLDWNSNSNDYLAGLVAEGQAIADSLPQTPGPGQASYSDTWTSGMITTILFGGSNWQTTQVSHGTHPFRDNNPGDLTSGSFTAGNGSIGSDGRFTVFPTSGTGRNALDSLLHGAAYNSLSVSDAISRYAPAMENNTAGYQQFVQNVVGVSGNAPLSSLSPSQFTALENGISRYEGYNVPGNYSVTTTSVMGGR